MKLGMSVEAGIPIPEIVEIVKEAERLGYDRCWVPDEGIIHRDVFVTLAMAASKTSSIQIGTGITNPYSRLPAVAAAAIATVNELSGGRAFFGLSSGGSVTLGPLGINPDHPLQAVREMIILSRLLLNGETVTLKGKYTTLNAARIPYTKKAPEIWLAARGNKMLRLGGELADGVQLGPMHKDFIGEYVNAVKQGAALTGNDPKLCWSVSIITDDASLNAIRSFFSFNIVDAPPAVKEALGIPPEMLEKLRVALMNGGPQEAGKLIKDEWVLPFVVAGTPAECYEQIEAICRRYGFSELRITLPGHKPDLVELARIAELLKNRPDRVERPPVIR